MNHGYCENCWWWEPIRFDVKKAKYVLGVCWSLNSQMADNGYCPDYYNRKLGNKENGTLEDWVKKAPAMYEYPEGTKLKKR
ncbi:MAG: hypothetical protein J6Y37_13965 [Paludibacteraceae bacterium]|nr:hypothetical protein [Paludibacteraceae bacterium]